MSAVTCRICGGEIEISADKSYGVCSHCGSMVTFPRIREEQFVSRYNRAHDLQVRGDFDRALAAYESLLLEDETDANLHWNCALCRFGIEYVEDPLTFSYIPTCHRASFSSILEDPDYLAAVENARDAVKLQYQKWAIEISNVQKAILAISRKEAPYDVFICYKESAEDGSRTEDSDMAEKIYHYLTDQGLRVFFARITLESRAGSEYEPYIFAALNSAKAMVVVGTRPEYFQAVWVKNEWSRYIAIMKQDQNKVILPCYRYMDPYDLPDQLSLVQSYDMDRISFLQDIGRAVEKATGIHKARVTAQEGETVYSDNPAINNLMHRGYDALSRQNWKEAQESFLRVQEIDDHFDEAYLGQYMAVEQAKDRTALENILLSRAGDDFDGYIGQNKNLQKTLHTKDEALRQEMEALLERVHENWCSRKYEQADALLNGKESEKTFRNAAVLFRQIGQWRDAPEKVQKAEELLKDFLYGRTASAVERISCVEDVDSCLKELEKFPGYRDTEKLIETCRKKKVELLHDAELEEDIKVISQAYKLVNLEEYGKAQEKLKEVRFPAEFQRQIHEIQHSGRKAALRRRIKCTLSAVAAVCVVVTAVTLVGRFNQKKNAEREAELTRDSAYAASRNGYAADSVDMLLAIESEDRKEVRQFRDSAADVLSEMWKDSYDAMKNGDYLRAYALIQGHLKHPSGLEDTTYPAKFDPDFVNEHAEEIRAGLYQQSVALLESEEPSDAMEGLRALGDYQDAAQLYARYAEGFYQEAVKLWENGQEPEAVFYFGRIHDYEDSAAYLEDYWGRHLRRNKFAVSEQTVALIAEDGRIRQGFGTELINCTDMTQVFMQEYRYYGIDGQGKIVMTAFSPESLSFWKPAVDIWVAPYQKKSSVYVLMADGTVRQITGRATDTEPVMDWRGIVQFASDEGYLIGLRADGTVAYFDMNSGTGSGWKAENWEDIVQLAVGSGVIGLKSDGTVVYSGYEEYDFSQWKDITDIAICADGALGLTESGTVLYNGHWFDGKEDKGTWERVKDIAGYENEFAVLYKNGDAVHYGNGEEVKIPKIGK